MSARGAAPTPARMTRARSKTPLPAVGAKNSHAYGAKGKTELRSQVRGGADDFAAAFASGRSTAAAGASAAPSVSGRSPSEQPGLEPAAPTAPTAMDSVAGYTGGGAANQVSENGPQRPASLSLLSRLGLLLLGLFLLFSGYMINLVPLSARYEAARHNVASGLRQALHAKPYDVPPADLADRWLRFQHDEIFTQQLPGENLPGLQWSININFLSRLERLEARVAALEGDIRLTNNTLSEIRHVLPATVLLRRIDGQYEIPEDFWMALQERMVEDSELAPAWKAWLSRNEAQMQQLQHAQLRGIFDSALENGEFVSRELFLQAIQENNEWLAGRYSQELKAMWQQNMVQLKALTAEAATEVIDRSEISHYAKRQIDILVKANHIHNINEALSGFNFFAPGGGARIDPRVTSPTASRKQKTWIASVWANINPVGPAKRPPIEALTKWDEATECWCGSPEWTDGPVNIGILTNHRIHPERLVIEHVPALSTLDVAAAPRDVEMWADAGSAKKARKLDNKLMEEYHHTAWLNCTSKPKPEFVCVGKGQYNIHRDNHVQSFSVSNMIEALGLTTNRMVIRVNTNWGADHTCIYRVRMAGTKA